MANPLLYEDIVKYVLSDNGNGCKLITTDEEFKMKKFNENKHNSEIKLSIQCKCTNIFESSFSTFKNANKKQCNDCGYKIMREKQKLGYNRYIQKINDKYGENEYIISGEYINYNTKLSTKHICGYTWMVTPHNLLKYDKSLCPNCSNNIKSKSHSKSHDAFSEELYNLVGNEYTTLDEYVNSEIPILIRHNSEKCKNHEFPMKPNNFLQGQRCPKCFGKFLKSTVQFKKEVFNLVGNEYTVLSEYVNARIKLSMRHNLCNEEYPVTPDDFLNKGSRCPFCNQSKGEERVKVILNKFNEEYLIEYKFKDLRDINCLRYDFAIFNDINKTDLKGLIEYDGEFHFMPIKMDKDETDNETEIRLLKQRYHDGLKNEYCVKNNIKLLRIPYWEFDNIEEIIHKEMSNYG